MTTCLKVWSGQLSTLSLSYPKRMYGIRVPSGGFQAETQCQDLETGCLKLTVVKFLGVQFFKGDHNILIFQP